MCESENEARDNGYWFYKYMCENHSEINCIYAIKRDSKDYDRVSEMGKTIEFGSFQHWIYYLAASINISSQKSGKPNAALCYFLEIYDLLRNKRLFLQHGVIINNCEWLHYGQTKMNVFVCGAFPEYGYVNEKFGYPAGSVQYLGLCRYDGLHGARVNKKRILIMPTWRKWITDNDKRTVELEGGKQFTNTEYFTRWSGLLQNKRLNEMINTGGYEVVFYPHREMQRYISCFEAIETQVVIANWKKWDIQELLKSSAIMITDYSSVFFDFIYMKKPVIFYQFDEEKFRSNQYKEGYFDYHQNPFGKSFKSETEIVSELNSLAGRGFKVDQTFIEGHQEYFKLYDQLNCERNYLAAKQLEGSGEI